MNQKPDFDKTLQNFLEAISTRNFDLYKAHITKDSVLYTIVQNGHAFTKRDELIAMHEEWFKDSNWIWKGSVVHQVVGEDLAMALIKYEYCAKAEDKPFSTWLTYVFRLEEDEWRVIHDHNTALDFHAFAKSAGLEN